MAVQFKQKCGRCRKNYVIVSKTQRYVTCFDCQKSELEGDITDPEMKKMFDIPKEFYKENSFLRDIKVKYLRYGNLSEKQIAAFKKVAEDMKKN